MKLPKGTAVFCVAALMSVPAMAQTAAPDVGKTEYLHNCAVCHGETGKGNGPMAGYGYQQVADLTTISKRNKGVFPFGRLYDVIDGRQMVKGHGSREMPIWGRQYNAKGWAKMYGLGSPEAAESYVQGRIVALIGYIYSLQEK